MKRETRARRLFFEHCEDRLLLADMTGGTPAAPDPDNVATRGRPVEVASQQGEGGFNALDGNRALNYDSVTVAGAHGQSQTARYHAEADDRPHLWNSVTSHSKFRLNLSLDSASLEVTGGVIQIARTTVRPFEPSDLVIADDLAMADSGNAAPAAEQPIAEAILEIATTTAAVHQSFAPGTGFLSRGGSEGGFADLAILRQVSDHSARDAIGPNSYPDFNESRATEMRALAVSERETDAELPTALAWNWRVHASRANAIAFDVDHGHQADLHARTEGLLGVPFQSLTPISNGVSPVRTPAPATEATEADELVPTEDTVSSSRRTDGSANLANARRPYFRSAPFIIAAVGTLLSKDYWQKLQPRRAKGPRRV